MSVPLPSQPADPVSSEAAPRRRDRSVPTIAGAGAIAMLALLVGLFSGGMSSASAAASPANALKAYQQCLASHGVKGLPRGAGGFAGGSRGGIGGSQGGGGNGGQPSGGSAPGGGAPRTAPKLTSRQKKAVKACRSMLPTGGFGGGNGANRGNRPGGAAFTAYLTCLTQHGVTVPTNGGFRNIDQNDPTVQAAESACASLRPTFGGRGQGGGQAATAAANA